MGTQDQSESSKKFNNGGKGSSVASNSGIHDTGVKAQQKTGEILDQAQEKVGEVTDKVKEQATTQISSQKDKAADSLGNVADAIRQTGDQLRQNEQVAPVAQYTDQLAQGVEMVSNYLKSKSLSEIVNEVERFARREPALFLGGALTVGLLAGRFLRSSSNSTTQPQNSSTTMALAKKPDYSSTEVYGSRSTGYSTPLSSDVVSGYSSYDLGGSTDTLADSLSGNYSGGSESYSGLATSSETSTGDYGLNSGSTRGSGFTGSARSGSGSSSSSSSGFPSSGYSASYPTDHFGSDDDQGYGSQGRTGGATGGPMGGV